MCDDACRWIPYLKALSWSNFAHWNVNEVRRQSEGQHISRSQTWLSACIERHPDDISGFALPSSHECCKVLRMPICSTIQGCRVTRRDLSGKHFVAAFVPSGCCTGLLHTQQLSFPVLIAGRAVATFWQASHRYSGHLEETLPREILG